MNALEKLKEATRMLAEVSSASDAKKLADIAAAGEYYARKAKLGEEAVGYAHGVKVKAWELFGAYWQRADKFGPGRPKTAHSDTESAETLDDLKVSAKQAMDAVFLHRLAEAKPEEFKAIVDDEKTLTQVRRELDREQATKTAALPSEKFRVIYADPPWKYNDALKLDAYGSTEYHYPSMSISELCALPVSDLAEDNAVLFLWATSPLLEESFSVVQAWGFEYRSSFVWDKIRHNVGHYNSVRHEFLLVCVRGSCTPDVAKLYDSVVTIERTEHSAKPEEFRTMIETLYTAGKKLELFARTEHAGWTSHGNQLQKSA